MLELDALVPVYKTYDRTPQPLRRPTAESVVVEMKIETYRLEQFQMRLGDVVWEYFVLVHSDERWEPGEENPEIAYRHYLGDTYMRQHYCPDESWHHEPEPNSDKRRQWGSWANDRKHKVGPGGRMIRQIDLSRDHYYAQELSGCR